MDRSTLRRFAMRTGFALHQTLWWRRAVTLGVRALVLDGRRVFLVRHTYRDGWFLPGGGVERGESAEAAVVRELREEGGIACAECPALHGLFRTRGRDHVACYVVRRFEVKARSPEFEIAEAAFFPVDSLPDGTTKATRARIDEVLRGKPIAETW